MFGFGKKKDLFATLYGPQAEPVRAGLPIVAASQLPAYQYRWDHGEKFPGGLGPVEIVWTDYWSLRARSSELFERNLYARGLIRRMVTNEINTCLLYTSDAADERSSVDL